MQTCLGCPNKNDLGPLYEHGFSPTMLQTLSYCPTVQKGSKAIAANYRPVSLTSHIEKIYERILRKKMVDHLEKNNLLCQNQHGFRKGKSCLTHLLHHFDDNINYLLSGNDVNAIYLDYAKAFDIVDHRLLLMKLHHYGLQIKYSNGSNLSYLIDTKKLSLMAGFPFLLSYSVACLRVQF